MTAMPTAAVLAPETPAQGVETIGHLDFAIPCAAVDGVTGEPLDCRVPAECTLQITCDLTTHAAPECSEHAREAELRWVRMRPSPMCGPCHAEGRYARVNDVRVVPL